MSKLTSGDVSANNAMEELENILDGESSHEGDYARGIVHGAIQMLSFIMNLPNEPDKRVFARYRRLCDRVQRMRIYD